MNFHKNTLLALGLICLLSTALCAQGTGAGAGDKASDQTQEYIEMMRKDLRKGKQSIVDQAMELEAADKVKFWGIYDKYQKELNVIGDQRLANIKKYAENFNNMTDAVADQLASTALNLEDQTRALRKKYYAQFKAAMNARIAVRFLQVESALGHLIELQLASEIPLMK